MTRHQKRIKKQGQTSEGDPGRDATVTTKIPPSLIARKQALADFAKGVERDLEALSLIKSRARKEEAKRETLIPKYWDSVNSFIRAGITHPLFTVILVWLFDAKEIARAMTLAKFCADHKIPMPTRIKRDIYTFVCDALAQWGDEELREGRTLEPCLSDLFALIEGADLHDQVTAKIYRMKGLHFFALEDWENAVAALQIALKFNAKVKTALAEAEKNLEARKKAESENDPPDDNGRDKTDKDANPSADTTQE